MSVLALSQEIQNNFPNFQKETAYIFNCIMEKILSAQFKEALSWTTKYLEH